MREVANEYQFSDAIQFMERFTMRYRASALIFTAIFAMRAQEFGAAGTCLLHAAFRFRQADAAAAFRRRDVLSFIGGRFHASWRWCADGYIGMRRMKCAACLPPCASQRISLRVKVPHTHCDLKSYAGCVEIDAMRSSLAQTPSPSQHLIAAVHREPRKSCVRQMRFSFVLIQALQIMTNRAILTGRLASFPRHFHHTHACRFTPHNTPKSRDRYFKILLLR